MKDEQLKYVVKTGNKYRTADFGYTKNIFNAAFYFIPVSVFGNEKLIRVRATVWLEELGAWGDVR